MVSGMLRTALGHRLSVILGNLFQKVWSHLSIHGRISNGHMASGRLRMALGLRLSVILRSSKGLVTSEQTWSHLVRTGQITEI